ncbi:hypothetical protein B0H11DRAFT_2216377 [Mycena galericulata]|nr:hypothetical protein B0H11DRAFT_2216377 [Mycena galericulata]
MPITRTDSNEEVFGDQDLSDAEQEHLQPIDMYASKEDIRKALEQCQLALGRVLAENRQLRQKNSEFEAASSAKRRRREKGDNQLNYETHVGNWSRAFLLTKEAWVRTGDFQKDCPELPANPQARFETNDLYSRGVTAALFDVIPEKYHPLLNYKDYKHLAKDFIAEHGSARSSLINTLRGVIASILTSAGHVVDSTVLGAASADRSQDKVLAGLLRFPQDKTPKVFAPILFPKGEKKMEYIFTNRIVLDVHRVMIHGPSSLVKNSKPDPKANGTKFGVYEATDHSIALAGILARFLISPDKTWASSGGVTKINWENDYRTYRKLLASNPDAPFIRHIFKTVNKHVFAGVPKTVGNTEDDGDVDVEDEINAAMERLAFGDFDDIPSDQDEGSAGDDQVPGPSGDREIPPATGPSRQHRTVQFADGPPEVQVFQIEEEQQLEEPGPGRRRSSRQAEHGSKGKQKALN